MIIYISRKRKGEVDEEEVDRLFWNFMELADQYRDGVIYKDELYSFYK